MRLIRILFFAVPLTALITALLYEPLSIWIFKLSEPYFAAPIKIQGEKLTIRYDARGDGDFGAKRRNGRSHDGIDIVAPVGTPVYASRSGMAFFGNVPTGYGKYVMIYHPDGFQTFYGHLSAWNGFAPMKIRRGELIGFVGKTGNASAKDMVPHLHFEIRKDGAAQDPRNLMR